MSIRRIRLIQCLCLWIILSIGILSNQSLWTNIDDNVSLRRISNDYEEKIEYLKGFFVAHPKFFDDESRQWFLNSSFYLFHSRQCSQGICHPNGFYFNHSRKHLTIKLSIVHRGLYRNEDCGYNYGDDNAAQHYDNEDEYSQIYDQAILYPVPDGWSFQHFLDGIGPKLAHSRSYLTEYPQAKVILLRGPRFDRSVKEIWSMLGVEESRRIVFIYGYEKIGARLLINPCRTPAIHPFLWNKARLMYWSISGLITNPPLKSSRKNFIYLQRTSSNAMNAGRLILNEKSFIDLCREFAAKHSLNYIEYDHSKDLKHIRSRIELFYNAQVIIGVHSGALSNMNFAQSGTQIIEIMPYRVEKSSLPLTCSMFRVEDLKACAGYILYLQSQLLNQTYWIYPNPVQSDGNLLLNLTRFQSLFEKISLD